MFTTLTFNLTNAAIRHETLQGKKFIVAPMAMLTEGVHNGSGGSLLYRESECKKAAPAWNMKPIVVYHPQINGQGVSACDPDILEKQQVGMVMNCRWDGKLRAEAWIEEDRAALVDNRVIEALEDNKMMEISTGLFTDNEGDPGEWEGTAYEAEAINHQPDHLALLPDKIGACSIADGAGLLQLNEVAAAEGLDLTPLFAREMDTLRRMVGNAMSHSNIYSALAKAVRAKMGVKNVDVWITDVYDGFFIYEFADDKKLYRLSYTASDKGVEITGEPEEVIRVTEYRTTTGEFVGNEAHKNEEQIMNKKEVVDGLIVNAALHWEEADRDTLMGFDEIVLNKMGTKPGGEDENEDESPTKDKRVIKNEEAPETLTTEEYIANAPLEIRDVLTNGLAAHETEKAKLIGAIRANAKNEFSEEFLATKGIAELQGLAALCAVSEPVANEQVLVPMFEGQATVPAPMTNEGGGDTDDQLLPLPIMNFETVPAETVSA